VGGCSNETLDEEGRLGQSREHRIVAAHFRGMDRMRNSTDQEVADAERFDNYAFVELIPNVGGI
jgi:hypothetical protein